MEDFRGNLGAISRVQEAWASLPLPVPTVQFMHILGVSFFRFLPQVMYRVIQVAEGQLDGQTEGTGAISGYPATQSMTQVGTPISRGGTMVL